MVRTYISNDRVLSIYAHLEGSFYIILKDSLRKIPALGYFMELFHFIFLSRQWKQDQIRMRETLDAILATGPSKMALLLYPEGTNMSQNTIQKSQSYAHTHRKPVLQNVLLPHTTGLYFCIKTLQSEIGNPYLLVRGKLTTGFHDCIPRSQAGCTCLRLLLYWYVPTRLTQRPSCSPVSLHQRFISTATSSLSRRTNSP